MEIFPTFADMFRSLSALVITFILIQIKYVTDIYRTNKATPQHNNPDEHALGAA
jgi:hypothetical protein